MDESTTYTTEQVLALVAAELGEEVDAPAIHQAVHRSAARPNARMRATAGLPAPINPGGSPLRFDRAAIDSWLRVHPRRSRSQLLDQLRVELAASERRRREAVGAGRAEGLSWAQLAQLISQVDGVSISRQAVARKYGKKATQ